MADHTVQSVGLLERDSRSVDLYQMVQDREAVYTHTRSGLEAVRPEKPIEKTEEKPAENLLPITQNNICLKFRVDDKTNAVTVYVIDRASKQVLRTIPADEVAKLHAGDLLKLLA